MLHLKLNKLNPNSYHTEIFFLFLIFYKYMRWWMLTYCGNHFMICISQIIMLYTSNLHSDIHWLYLSKTGRNYFQVSNRRGVYYNGKNLNRGAQLTYGKGKLREWTYTHHSDHSNFNIGCHMNFITVLWSWYCCWEGKFFPSTTLEFLWLGLQ